jgi:DNA polymerase/3'-5' exonuclease PolX
MSNEVLAQRLREHAACLAKRGDNLFRVRAFRHAAFTVMSLQKEAEKLTRDEWAKLPGIGNSLAETLVEYARSGKSPSPLGGG